MRAVDGPYLTSLLGCKHECKWATQAIEVGANDKRNKTNRERSSGISCGRIPRNGITHPSTYLGWILYGRVRRAEPWVKVMHPPSVPKYSGLFYTGASPPRTWCSAQISSSWQRVLKTNSPSASRKVLPLHQNTARRSCGYEGVGNISTGFVCFALFACLCLIIFLVFFSFWVQAESIAHISVEASP